MSKRTLLLIVVVATAVASLISPASRAERDNSSTPSINPVQAIKDVFTFAMPAATPDETVGKTGVPGAAPPSGSGPQTVNWTIDYGLTSSAPLHTTLNDTWSAGQVLVPGSLKTPGALWSASQPNSTSLNFTNALVAANGKGLTQAFPRPIGAGVTFTGSGDGYNPVITASGKLMGVNHHSNPTPIWCFDMNTGAACPGYKKFLSGATGYAPVTIAIGNKIYFSDDSSNTVYGQTGHIYCWDSDTNASCGQSPQVFALGMALVSGKLFTLRTTGFLDCYDPSNSLNRCAGFTPVNLGMPTGNSNNYTNEGDDLFAVGSRVYVANYQRKLTCFDSDTNTICAGWPVLPPVINTTASGNARYNLFPRLNAAGGVTGVCVAGQGTNATCYNLDSTSPVEITMSLTHVMSMGFNTHTDVAVGTRVFFPNFFNAAGLSCFDWATQARCTGAGFNGNGITNADANSAYGLTTDGVNVFSFGDQGVLRSWNTLTGATPSARVATTATVNIDSFYCGSATPISATWDKIVLTDVNLSAGVEFTSLKISLVDPATGATVFGPTEAIGTGGVFDVSAVSASLRKLQLVADETPVGTNAWNDNVAPKATLTFANSTPVQFCYQTTTTCAGISQVLTDTINTSLDPHSATATVAACVPSASLSVVKSAPFPSLVPGHLSTYSITVTNNGNLDATSATVKDALPIGLDLMSAVGAGWDCAPPAAISPVGTVTCTFSGGLIPAGGGTSIINLEVRPRAPYAGTTVINYVSVDPSGGNSAPTAGNCIGAGSPVAGCGVPVSSSVGATPPNSAPIAQNQSVTTNAETAATIALGATDADGNSLTYAIVSGPSHGSLNGAGANRTYTPASNYVGPDSFTFRASDGIADSNTATVSINVNALNAPPIALADSYSVTAGLTVQVAAPGVISNDSDVDSPTLTAVLDSTTPNGTLTLNPAGSLTYMPNAGFAGIDTFTYHANDGTLNSNIATVSINVTAPVCVNHPADLVAWYPANGNVFDVMGGNQAILQNGATFAAGIVGQAFDLNNDGNATNQASSDIVRVPRTSSLEPQRLSVDAWVYPRSYLWDSEGGVIISKDTSGTSAGTGASYALIGPGTTQKFNAYVRFTDGTQPRIISAHAFALNQWHHVAMTWDGSSLKLYVDGSEEASTTTGPRTIAYSNHDLGIGKHSTAARGFDGLIDEVEIFNRALSQAEIQSLYNASSAGKCNSTAVAHDQSVTTNEDTAVNITLTATDADGNFLNYSIVDGPTNGTLTGNAPNLTYTPNSNYNGGDSFTFKVNDGFSDSNTATVSINVNGVNDPPTASCRDLTLATSGGGAACPPGQDCKKGGGTKHCKAGDPTCIPTVGSCLLNVSGNQVDSGSSDPDGDELTYSLSPAGPFTVGTTAVTLTVTDPDGASSSCSANITVIDDTSPIPIVTKLADVTGECSVTLTPPTAVDDCAGTIQGTTTDPLTYDQPGTYSITWTYSDGHGNVTTQNQQAMVQDTTPPVVPSLPGSPQTFTWVSANTPAGAPSARIGHAMVYDPVHAKVILFGGEDSQTINNEIWELDSASNIWTNVTPASGPMPSPRFYAAMAFEPSNGNVLLFGGQLTNPGPSIAGDTWEWETTNHTWSLKASSSVIGNRLGSAMAYDPNLHQMILFGGRDFSSFGSTLTQTFAWDGTTWQQLAAPVGPIGRYTQGMVTDTARSKIVMFGGYNGNLLGDTWEWNGGSWTLVAPNGSGPFMRSGPGLAYDSARQRTVLFGGSTGQSASDTWEWNGTVWTQVQTQANPSGRSTPLVYDSAQAKLVLFGGDSLAQLTDTWYSQVTSGLPTVMGECSATVTAPIANDNCVGLVTGTTSDPTTYTSPGTYTIHWLYDDGHGNTSTQTQTVIVKDTTAPVPDAATLPDITAGCSAALPPAPTATDNCDGHIVGVPNKTGPFGQGDDVITWTFTDHAGNVGSQTQAVHVHDTTPPLIDGLGADYGWSNVNVSGPTPPARVGHQLVYDSARKKVILFGGQTIQGSLFGGQTLPSNSYLLNDLWEWDGATRTWTQVTPASGPAPSPRSFFGMAYDPGRGKVVLYGGKVDAIYYSTNSETWEWDPATRTWTSFPAAGDINFGGMRGPQIAYDSNLHQPILFGGIMYWGGHNGATWSWDGAHWILRSTTGPTARIGHAMATDFARNRVVLFGGYDYTGNDYAGLFDPDTWEWNGNSWTRFAVPGPGIRIGDAMSVDNLRGVAILFGGTQGGSSSDPPVFNDTWEWNGASWLHRTMLASPGARDTALAFDGFTTLMFGGRNDNGPALGETWVIQQSGSADITVDADHDRCSAVVNFATPTGTDNCGPANVVTNPPSGSNFPVGTTPVTVTATDANGNSSTATFNVTVRDHQAPTPDLATLPAITGECSATIPAPPHATDNCGGAIVGTTADPLSYSTQGAFTVTWHFSDGHGNESSQTQTVIVKDVTKPAPNLASLPDVTGECSATIPSAPTASDNCAGTITGATSDPLTYSNQGTFVVHWTYDDGHGNISTQDQNVIVRDITKPVPNLASLPDVTGECSATIPSVPKASDNCAGMITGTTNDPLTYSAQGTFVVHWTYDDGHGNISTQDQNVIVKDVTKPVPNTASLPNVIGECSATIPSAPTATDNCAGGITGTTTDPLAYTEQGTFAVTWHYSDGHGNESTQTQTVIVKDTTPPALNVPVDVTVNTGAGATSCSALVPDSAIGSATATDNCELQSLIRSGVPAGNIFPVGTTVLTYTATDIHGKVTTKTQRVTVVDDTIPVLNVPANITIGTAADASSCTAFVNNAMLTPTATDNCGVDVNSLTRTGVPAGNNFPVGITFVTYSVRDVHGNQASGTQSVTVTDATLPVITLTGKTITLWPPDHKYQTIKITDLIASAADNCDPNVTLSKVIIAMVTSDEPENTNGGDGNTVNDIVIAPDCKSVDLRAERDGSRNGRVYTIYFQVKDSAGNVQTVKATVTVPKSQGPGGAAIDDTPAYPLLPPYKVLGSCPP